MQTNDRIDDFQQTYFAIESFNQLLAESYREFQPIYQALEGAKTHEPPTVRDSDVVLTLGTQSYASVPSA